MKGIIDDFGKGIDLDANEIVAYRSSQHGVFSKEAGIGRYLAQTRDYGWIYRHGTINCVQQVAFKADIMKSESKIYVEATIKVG